MVDALSKDYPDTQLVLSALKIDRAQLVHCRLHGKPPVHTEQYRTLKRLYNAILLFAMIQEWPLSKILPRTSTHSSCSTAGIVRVGNEQDSGSVSRGQLQQLLQDATTLCGMLVVFCDALNYDPLCSVLSDLQTRLCYGIKSKDILPLMRLGSEVMSVSRARVLVKAKIESPKDLLTVSPEHIAQILLQSLPFHERIAMDTLHGRSRGDADIERRGAQEYSRWAWNDDDDDDDDDKNDRDNCESTTTTGSIVQAKNIQKVDGKDEKIYKAYLRLAEQMLTK
jgi:hypothetical protein